MRYDLIVRTSFFTLVTVTAVFIVWNYVNAHPSMRLTSYFGAESHTLDERRPRYDAVPTIQAAAVQESYDRHSVPVQSHNHITSAVTLASVDPYSLSDDVSSIHGDLLRCSRAMGISEVRLKSDTDTIRQVAQTAKQFLDAVHLVIPKWSLFVNHKNPCFSSNFTIGDRLTQILLTYLRPEIGRGLKQLQKVYSSEQLLKMAAHQKSLMCLPFFYIAGFPKCATTSLHQALHKHTHIVAPLNKEPHWWTRVKDLGNSRNLPQEYVMLYVWTYLIFFKEAAKKVEMDDGNDIITYDGSQSLLWDSNFSQHGHDYCAMPAVLSRAQPRAKFIVVMRNPTIRLYSHFLWSFKYRFGGVNKWPTYIKQNVSNSFHSDIVSITNKFKACLKSSSLFECASDYKKKESVGQIHASHRFYIGLYYVHIKKWLQFIPRKQFLFLRMEDMVANFSAAMAQIVDFLELKEGDSAEVESWMTKANAQVVLDEKHLMQNRTKALLDEVYGPYNLLLANLLDSEKYLWMD